jgi:hypothetical protein
MPPLPLASPADAARLGYTLKEGAEMEMLARASARIRREAGQQISQTTSTVRLTSWRGHVTLPSPPVSAVATVERVLYDGTSETYTGWLFDGHNRVNRVCGDVIVTYTHGWDPIPDELLELVCSVASRLGATPDGGGMEAGIRSESIDDYSVTYAAESLAMASGLLEGEIASLRSILGSPPTAYVVGVR